MDEDLERAAVDAIAAGDGRTLDIRLMSWGEVADTPQGREVFVPGAFANVDPSRVMLESGARMVAPNGTHAGAIIVGAATSIEERTDGAYATFRVAPSDAGNELLALVTDRVLRDASVVFRPRRGGSRIRPDGVTERTDVDLFRVGVVERGAYRSAQIVAARSAGEDSNVDPETAPIVGTVDAGQLMARMATIEGSQSTLEDRIAAAIASVGVPSGAPAHPLAAYHSLGEYARAAYDGPSAYSPSEVEVLARTLADQITTNNAGMIPPAWLSDVKRIINLGRRVIAGFGGAQALPSYGMEVDWPYLTSSNTLVGVQSTQKTEVTSARVDIAKGSQALATYAGGSDISYQLIQRSSPSYRDAYDRIMLAAWGMVTDAAFATALAAGATTTRVLSSMLGTPVALQTSAAADDLVDASAHGLAIGDAIVFTSLTGGAGLTAGRVYWVTATGFTTAIFRPAATPNGAAIDFTTDITAGNVAKVTDTGVKARLALFEASAAIEDATGSPAGIVLASSDMYLMLAGLSTFVPATPDSNPSNASGTTRADTLRLDSSGLTIVRAPNLAAGSIIESNSSAAAWFEDGPKWATAEDAAKLGQNVAVYSFGAAAIFVPAGIVKSTLI